MKFLSLLVCFWPLFQAGAYEPFDYPVGTPLNEQADWTTGPSLMIREGAVAMPIYSKPAGQSLLVPPGSEAGRRSITPNTEWLSFFIKLRNTSLLRSSAERLLSLGSGERREGSVNLRKHPDHKTAYQLGLHSESTPTQWVPRTLIPGSTYLLIVQQAPGKETRLWINPIPASWDRDQPPSPDLAVPSPDSSPNQDLKLHQLRRTSYELDELRWGPTWPSISHSPAAPAKPYKAVKSATPPRSTEPPISSLAPRRESNAASPPPVIPRPARNEDPKQTEMMTTEPPRSLLAAPVKRTPPDTAPSPTMSNVASEAPSTAAPAPAASRPTTPPAALDETKSVESPTLRQALPPASRSLKFAPDATLYELTPAADLFIGPSQFSAAGAYPYLRVRNKPGIDQDLITIVRFELDLLDLDIGHMAKQMTLRFQASLPPDAELSLQCHLISTNHPLHRLAEDEAGRHLSFDPAEATLIATQVITAGSTAVEFRSTAISTALLKEREHLTFVISGATPSGTFLECSAREAAHAGIPRLTFETPSLFRLRLPRQALMREAVRTWHTRDGRKIEARLLGVIRDHVMLMSDDLENENVAMQELSVTDIAYLLRLAH